MFIFHVSSGFDKEESISSSFQIRHNCPQQQGHHHHNRSAHQWLPFPFFSDNHTPAAHIIHAQYQPPVTPNAGNASLLVFYIITLAGWIEARRVVGLEETATYNRHNSTERCCTETRTTWQGHTSMLAAISCVSACQDI